MSRRDWRWWGSAFALVLLLAVGLHAAAWSLPSAGSRFSGFLINSGDGYTYQAFARSYAEGGWLIDNPYATAPRPPAFFNLYWLVVGTGMRLTGLPFIPVHYAAGIVAAALLYLAILLVMREFLGEGPRARFAFLLAGFGSGAGWLAALALPEAAVRARSPLDLYYPEGFPLQAALGFPHQALSFALLAFVMLWAWRGTVTGRRRWMAAAGGLSFVLGFFHPFPLVTIAAVMVAWYLVLQLRRGWAFLPRWLDLCLLGVGILPPVFYYRWLFAANGNFAGWGREWGQQEIVGAAGFSSLLLGFGPLAALAAVGLWRRWRKNEIGERTLFLATWVVAGGSLVFLRPVGSFDAKLVEGLVLPLGALGAGAVFGRDALAGGAEAARRWLLAGALFLPLLPSHAWRAANALRVVEGREVAAFPPNWKWQAVVGPGESEALAALGRIAPPGSVIFSGFDPGIALPALAGVRPYVGHEHATPGSRRRQEEYRWFYSPAPTSRERETLFRRERIDYLWYGREKRSLPWFRPDREPWLERLFDNGVVGIYRLAPAAPRSPGAPSP